MPVTSIYKPHIPGDRHAAFLQDAHLEGIVWAPREPLLEPTLWLGGRRGRLALPKGVARCGQPGQHEVGHHRHHTVGEDEVDLSLEVVPSLVQLGQDLHGDANANLNGHLDGKIGVPQQTLTCACRAKKAHSISASACGPPALALPTLGPDLSVPPFLEWQHTACLTDHRVKGNNERPQVYPGIFEISEQLVAPVHLLQHGCCTCCYCLTSKFEPEFEEEISLDLQVALHSLSCNLYEQI